MTDEQDNPLRIVDSAGLTDSDWAAINRLKSAYKTGGAEALSKVMNDLSSDPHQAVCVLGAFFPDEMREAIRDGMAEMGMTREDLDELIRKLDSPARDQ